MAGQGSHWLERVARWSSPDLVICNSRFTATLTSRWLPAAPVEHVYCPVSAPNVGDATSNRRSIRQSLSTPLDDVVIVQVSRLEPWKGQHMLLKALGRLRDVPGWTCWIVGGVQRPSELAYMRQLESIAGDGHIDERVRFVGERADVPALLTAADVFCQPNTSPEPFGLSLVEAMQAGLPVVTSGIGGACEVVDVSCGLLTPPGDLDALADGLKRLIVDRELSRRLGDAARRRPRAICDAAQQMRRIHEVLSAVVAA
jgi:glycosyltransferase involved in cell wall biosynthesis